MKTYIAAIRTLLVFVVAALGVLLTFFYIQRWNVSPLMYIAFTVLFLTMLTDMFRRR